MADGEGRRTRSGRFVMPLLLIGALGACGLPGRAKLDVAPTAMLTGPKVVAIMGTRNGVVAALEEALAGYGFTFSRYQNRGRAAETVGRLPMGENPADATRYAIEVVPDIFDVCAGGGFQLTSLRVSVVERATNQLMLRTTASGRTEKCPPTSGTIFHDIAKEIDAAWQR